MLNEEYKNKAVRDLKKADQQYTAVLKKTLSDMERLHSTRKIAVGVIQRMENYISGLSGRPHDYDKKTGEVRLRYQKFLELERQIRNMQTGGYTQPGSAAGISGVAGVIGGAGLAAFGPAAAVSAAMTFGTTSAGTAIASLSGAAATNAALAWLGGGSMAAGGAGMLGGQVMLNLMGPVGWIIGGVSLAGSLAALNLSNIELARRTEKSIIAIKKEMQRISRADVTVNKWNKETKMLSNKISQQLLRISRNRKKDYADFTQDEKQELGALINTTEVLSKKLGAVLSGRSG